MKKAITLTCLSLSALIILDSLNAGQAVVMFLLMGDIPGTSVSISASVMLQLFAIATGITAWRLLAKPLQQTIQIVVRLKKTNA